MIYITLKAAEINDGYQYIKIYDGPHNSSVLLATKQFEHTTGKLNTSWQVHSILITGINLTANLSQLVIRYDASGFAKDDWQNKDLIVQFVFKK